MRVVGVREVFLRLLKIVSDNPVHRLEHPCRGAIPIRCLPAVVGYKNQEARTLRIWVGKSP
jgi:hypothetical protein